MAVTQLYNVEKYSPMIEKYVFLLLFFGFRRITFDMFSD